MKNISVVIPVRNRRDNLKKAVASLLKQTFSKHDFEIIVVDYGGEDDSRKMLEDFKDSRIRYFYVDEKGIWNLPRARNAGIRNSEGEFIICVDADMILSPDILEIVYNDFKERRERVLYQIPRRDIMQNGETKLHPPGPFPGDFQAAHRDRWFKVRGFDERMAGYGYEDSDLVKRMKRIGVKQYWMPSTVKIYHQYHKQSPAEEVYINVLKSLLNFSYKANDKDWGSAEKKYPSLRSKITRGFDLLMILVIILPIKKIKKFLREIKHKGKD